MSFRSIRPGAVLALTWIATASFAAPPLAAQSSAEADGRPAPLPSVELPPELERVLRDYERRWAAGDAEALAALFVEEGLIVSRGSWIRGRERIRRAYEGASGPLRLRAVEYETEGDLGFIVGAYGYGEERPVDDRGLFVLTLRRADDGRWLIVSDMDRGVG